MGVEIQGMAEAVRFMEHDFPAAVGASLQGMATAAAEPILAEAALRAPRDDERAPPELADSMVHETREREPTFVLVEGGPSEDVWYAHFPEFGTANQAARPYLRPAIDTQTQQATVEAVNALREAVKDAL